MTVTYRKFALGIAATALMVAAIAHADDLYNIFRAPIFAKGGISIGKPAVAGLTAGSATNASRITSTVCNGPGGSFSSAGSLVYQFPSVATNACEDSKTLTFDGGSSGSVSMVSFGDVCLVGLDQVLQQADAGATLSAYVFAPNVVAVRYCNLAGNSQGLPDASYYVRCISDQ